VRREERGGDQDRHDDERHQPHGDDHDQRRRRALTLLGDLGQVLDLVLGRVDRMSQRALVFVAADGSIMRLKRVPRRL
jgi:hypothetical protein